MRVQDFIAVECPHCEKLTVASTMKLGAHPRTVQCDNCSILFLVSARVVVEYHAHKIGDSTPLKEVRYSADTASDLVNLIRATIGKDNG